MKRKPITVWMVTDDDFLVQRVEIPTETLSLEEEWKARTKLFGDAYADGAHFYARERVPLAKIQKKMV